MLLAFTNSKKLSPHLLHSLVPSGICCLKESENNVAHIDPAKCKNCGMCAKECPTGAIANIRTWVREQQAAAKAAAEAHQA